MSKRNVRYTDEFRASAVLMLTAAGYPDKKGALAQTARHLKMPIQTLRGWWRQHNNPPPAKVRTLKREELLKMIDAEIGMALDASGSVRQDASWRDLMVGFGILVDKKQLLSGEPTENTNATIRIIRDGISSVPEHLARRPTANHPRVQPVQRAGNGAKMGEEPAGN